MSEQPSMYGSRVEYIVQIRNQDYWLDMLDGVFRYKDEAAKHYELARKYNPDKDFKIVKRTHSFIDELITYETYSI